MKIELTIKTTYLPSWGAWEGIRELVQNGRDAETEFSAPLKVSHSGTTLRIENTGCTLPHEALLLGFTSKTERADLIGKFGEGLKLGILALVRAGHAVKIRSGAEVWTPRIAPSDKFHADVLVFDVQGGREDKNRVRVEIGGVSAEAWAEYKGRFLFLVQSGGHADTSYGSILLDEARRSEVYVKGIFVMRADNLRYGYNFSNIDVDRDRKMIHGWDLRYHTQASWRIAVGDNLKLYHRFMTLVEEAAEDVRELDGFSTSSLSKEVAVQAATEFLAKYGPEAFPVANEAEGHDIEHLGKRGVVVKAPHLAVLSRHMGKLADVKAALHQEVVKVHSLTELEAIEVQNLFHAKELLRLAGVVDFWAFGTPTIDVVDFRSGQKFMGMYRVLDNHVLLSRHILATPEDLLTVLVHEVAHSKGMDGDKGHVEAIEKHWARITSYLREENRKILNHVANLRDSL